MHPAYPLPGSLRFHPSILVVKSMSQANKLYPHIDRKNRRGPLRHRCEYCKDESLTDDAIRCRICLCVRYCSDEHASLHGSGHKNECLAVKEKRDGIEEWQRSKDQLTANPTGDTQDDFEQLTFFHVALQSQHCLYVDLLASMDTLDGCQMTLEAGCRYLKLFPADEDGVRYQMAIIMLQLDMDHECWDFMYWWRTNDRCDMDTGMWQDPGRLRENGLQTDVFKRLSFADVTHHYPVFLAISILIKLKLAIDLKNLSIAKRMIPCGKLPTEIVIQIVPLICRSPLARPFFPMQSIDLDVPLTTLCNQISQLGNELNKADLILSEVLVRNRNMLKSLRRRRATGLEARMTGQAGLTKEECVNPAKVYSAFHQTSEAFSMLRLAENLSMEQSKYSGKAESPWDYIIPAFRRASVPDKSNS